MVHDGLVLTKEKSQDTNSSNIEDVEQKNVKKNDKTRYKVSNRMAARLSAVQSLYQMDLTKKTLQTILFEIKNYPLNNDLFDIEKMDFSHFETIMRGIIREQKVLDPLINSTLNDDWSLKKVNLVVRSILRSGVYELLYLPDVPPKVVINEYTNLCSSLEDDKVVNMVNGVLDSIAKSHNLLKDSIKNN
jgi:N utilization substance protein B